MAKLEAQAPVATHRDTGRRSARSADHVMDAHIAEEWSRSWPRTGCSRVRDAAHGIIKDALLAVYAFKTEVIDENTLVQAFKAVEWEKFPPFCRSC